MKYTKIRLYTSIGYAESLSNLWSMNDCSIVELKDAVEDAKDAKDLLMRLRRMNLLRSILFDRETDTKIRFKCTDGMGNTSYLEIIRPLEKDEKAVTAKWVIAIGNTEVDDIKMFYVNGDVKKVKEALVKLALEDKENDEESFEYGTQDVSGIDEDIDDNNVVIKLNAFNVFSDYHINYTALRLDAMKLYRV